MEEERHVLPPSPLDPSLKICVAYHTKGMCNKVCLNDGNHGDYTQEQDMSLWEWCRLALPSTGAPANPQE